MWNQNQTVFEIRWICLNLTTTKSNSNKKKTNVFLYLLKSNSNKKNNINLLKSNKGKKTTYTVFSHIVSTDTILFWIWKSKGHSTYIKPKIAVHKSKDHSNFEELTLWNLIKSMNIHSRLITYLTFKNKTFVFEIKIKTAIVTNVPLEQLHYKMSS